MLANNAFTDSGNFATIVASTPKLSYLDVRDNQMTGLAPAALCNYKLEFCGLVDPKFATNKFDAPPACLKAMGCTLP